MRGGIAIQRDDARRSVSLHCPIEKPLRSSHIPMFAQQEVDGLPVFVDCAIKIGPLPFDLYIGLITSPRAIDRPRKLTPTLFKFRNIALDPSENCRMCQGDPSLRHHLDQVP